ncbi:MAG: EAL domain-containing protein, partial [Acidimicrobiales bacterium]|nr:EAL domain-containing protein [Acidimicrobiales bacterium]
MRFALISAALLTSVGLVLANWFAEIQRDRALGEAARTAELVARAATGDVLHVEQLRRDFVPMDEADRVQFDDKVRSIISDDGIVRFKIWNAQHWIVYSDNPRLIGRWFPGDDQLAQALAGESSSMVTDLSDPEEMEERDFGRLLAVYVPLRLDATTGELTGDGDGEVVGAFEIYVPYSTIDAALADDLRLLYLSLAISLAVLYLALFRLVAGASRKLRLQAAMNAHQATHDLLTDLPNRRELVARLQDMLDRRYGDKYVALALLDLDRFKEVNDALGHHRGDYLLQQVAKRLTTCLPSHCFVGRLGGDEFAVVVPLHGRDDSHAQECAEAIVRALCEPVLSDGLTMQIGVSIGIAVAPHHGDEQDQLFRRADMTMYVAKRAGGGWAMWRPEFEEESARSFHLATALRSAIEHGAISMSYQPRVSVKSGRVLGFEALARWTDPVLGPVPPNEFVAAAQVAGVSLPLVSHIVRTSLSDFVALRRADPSLVMAVNVTTTDLVMQGFEEMLFSTLDAAGLPHGALILELSEGEAIQNAKLLHQVLQRLGDRGVKLAIDDFGQGYSSMDRLRSLPLNEIKIDKGFVAKMQADPTDRAIV